MLSAVTGKAGTNSLSCSCSRNESGGKLASLGRDLFPRTTKGELVALEGRGEFCYFFSCNRGGLILRGAI